MISADEPRKASEAYADVTPQHPEMLLDETHWARAAWNASARHAAERVEALIAAFDAWAETPTWGCEEFERFTEQLDALRPALAPDREGDA